MVHQADVNFFIIGESEMKNVVLLMMMVLVLGQGCSSEQEKIQQAQIDTCRSDIKSGKEPTQFCVNLLPEYRQLANIPNQYDQPQMPQVIQPQAYPVQPAPVVVQQPVQSGSSAGDTIRDMAIGGMIGHALSSNGNNNNGNSYNGGYSSRPNVTRNVTIINKATPTPSQPVVQPVAPKKNYMDTSKFGSVGVSPKPAPSFSKPSGMNLGALSRSSSPSRSSINLKKR